MNKNEKEKINLDQNFYRSYIIFNTLLFVIWIILFIYTIIFKKKKKKEKSRRKFPKINNNNYNKISERSYSNSDMRLETLLPKVENEGNFPKNIVQSKK
jgi:hypothetical protein